MHKILFIGLLAICMLCNVAYAQNLEVQEISEDGLEAVLIDRDTGTAWDVVEGDEIDEWTVIEIDDMGVTIQKEPEGETPYAIVHRLSKMSGHGVSSEP